MYLIFLNIPVISLIIYYEEFIHPFLVVAVAEDKEDKYTNAPSFHTKGRFKRSYGVSWELSGTL